MMMMKRRAKMINEHIGGIISKRNFPTNLRYADAIKQAQYTTESKPSPGSHTNIILLARMIELCKAPVY